MVKLGYGDIYGLLTINNFRSKTACTVSAKGNIKTAGASYESCVVTMVQKKPLPYMFSIYITLQNWWLQNGFCSYNKVRVISHTLSTLVSLFTNQIVWKVNQLIHISLVDNGDLSILKNKLLTSVTTGTFKILRNYILVIKLYVWPA
jgi:hypothetical protein